MTTIPVLYSAYLAELDAIAFVDEMNRSNVGDHFGLTIEQGDLDFAAETVRVEGSYASIIAALDFLRPLAYSLHLRDYEERVAEPDRSGYRLDRVVDALGEAIA